MHPHPADFYFDPAHDGTGFCLVPHGQEIRFAWFGFDRSGGRLFVVGSAKQFPPNVDYPDGYWMGDAITASAKGPKPTATSFARVGTLWLREAPGALVAELRLLSSFVTPADVSPRPPTGQEETFVFGLTRL